MPPSTIALVLIQNAALLLAMAVVFDVTVKRWQMETISLRQAGVGVVIGGIGIALMMTPWVFAPGIIFDTRSILLSVSGLFFGWVPTLIAVLMTAVFRIVQGGPATLMGVSVIITTGALGVLWRHIRRGKLSDIRWLDLYTFGLINHIAMLLLAFTLSLPTAIEVLKVISIPVILIYPLGTVLLGELMKTHLRHQELVADLQASEERLRLASDAANIGFFDWNFHTNLAHFSAEWKRQIGYQADEFPDQYEQWQRRVHPDDLARVLKQLDACMQGQSPLYDAEYRLHHKDGSYRWILARGKVLPDEQGKPQQLIGCHVDVTTLKQTETALQTSREQYRLLNVELEQRVRERTAQWEAANQELESFAYSVSHDLRAPLRAVDGFSAVLQEEYLHLLDEQGRHYLTRIREGAVRMDELIRDLLGLSRVTRSEFIPTTVDLSAMAETIIRQLQSSSPERNIQVTIAPNLITVADPNLIRIVMENLINNAFKFTASRSQAEITIGVTRKDGILAYFVQDNGVGFDMAYANKLFNPFQRLHPAQAFPGTGIGLVTVKRIITRHGGQVWAEAKLDAGAAVYFTLGGNG